jgi:hypothetical protein
LKKDDVIMNPSPSPGMDRRTAIKWMLTAAASIAALDREALGASELARTKPATGYGTDPDLMKAYKPGDVWPLTLNPDQLATTAALCDVIIPADAKGPSASSVNVHLFVDEWISAPYEGHDADRKVIVEGLAWLEEEAQKRFKNRFVNLVASQKNAICDDICSAPKAKPEFAKGAQFFRKFRDLAAGGYYTTPEGMKDIGYVGNMPLASFDGPPPEVLKKLGLA